MTRPVVIVVDPEPASCRAMVEQLRHCGRWTIAGVRSAGSAARAIARRGAVLVVASATLLGEIPQDWPPVILVGQVATATQLASPVAFNLPAPVRIGDLVARIESMIESRGPDIRLGGLHFRPETKMMVEGEGEGATAVRLTEKEVALIERLAAAAGAVVDRARLLEELWGYGAQVSTHTLETHVYRLRRKLADLPGGQEVIITAPGGYRLGLALGRGQTGGNSDKNQENEAQETSLLA